MATPTVTGISALLVQDWRNQFPGEPDLPNAALKALLANSGDDLGNPGPDCQYGFGTVRARQAIDSLRDGGVLLSEVGDGGTGEHLVIVQPGDAELRITLAWDDEPAAPLPVFALVNDLDLVVTDPAGDRVFPWTIDPADPGAPATRSGVDRLNNMEQVSVENPMPPAKNASSDSNASLRNCRSSRALSMPSGSKRKARLMSCRISKKRSNGFSCKWIKPNAAMTSTRPPNSNTAPWLDCKSNWLNRRLLWRMERTAAKNPS